MTGTLLSLGALFTILALLAVSGCSDTGIGEGPDRIVTPPPPGKIYHAAYPDFGGWEDEVSASRVTAFSDLVGKPIAWAMFSNNWWQPDPGIRFPGEHVEMIHATGAVPYIRMMPRNRDELLPDPDYSMQAFVDGEFDDELRKWAAEAKKTGIPLIVEFGTEMNGSWFPWNAMWNGAGTRDGYGDPDLYDGPERFRDAYRHIIDIFNAEGSDNITWVFHVDANPDPVAPWNRMADYYPGDDYIDWIGVSVYGPQEPGEQWRSFDEILSTVWSEILTISTAGKPIAIAEWGVIDDAATGDKSTWIRDAFAVLGPDGPYPEIAAISYWHENFDETNLRVDSSPEALDAYRMGIASDRFITELSVGGRP